MTKRVCKPFNTTKIQTIQKQKILKASKLIITNLVVRPSIVTVVAIGFIASFFSSLEFASSSLSTKLELSAFSLISKEIYSLIKKEGCSWEKRPDFEIICSRLKEKLERIWSFLHQLATKNKKIPDWGCLYGDIFRNSTVMLLSNYTLQTWSYRSWILMVATLSYPW